MSMQIALRLSPDLVAYIDSRVKVGAVKSRAGLVARLIEEDRRRNEREREVEILRNTREDPYPDLAGLTQWAAARPHDDLD
ncbi:MAG: hypothetical protein ACREN8_13240 [Candidatus Dormibacteraceae bacterium]